MDSAAAGTTFELEVTTLAGGRLAVIPDAQGSWQLGDVLGRLPEVLPRHRYQLVKGEAMLAPRTAIQEWVQPVDGRACITAVVASPPTQQEQRQLDEALFQAARKLNVQRVRELLLLGADATFEHCTWTVMTALHAAVEASAPRRPGDGKDMEREEEEEAGKLKAVLGALLSARADVDARQKTYMGGGRSSTCALLSAAQSGNLGRVRVLLDARANVEAVSHRTRMSHGLECEYTALHVATQAGNLPLAALLLERRANVNAVGLYADPEEEEVDPNLPALLRLANPVHATALHMAVEGGHQALVALLVQAGADASIGRWHDGEETSLEELCAGKPGMLDVLRADSSAALLAGGAFGPEVEVAVAAFARASREVPRAPVRTGGVKGGAFVVQL